MCNLYHLLSAVEVTQIGTADLPVLGLTYLATAIEPGWVFVACDTPWMDGVRGIVEARSRGAVAIVLQDGMKFPSSTEIPFVVVPDSKRAYTLMCAAFFGHPERDLLLYGVTGTKGKSSTCFLIEAGLRKAGFRTGIITTICRKSGMCEIPSNSTTPEPFVLYGTLKQFRDLGTTHVVIEASSIGLAEGRLTGLNFEGVAFTNLGTDHLTYHGGKENYKNAKLKLFTDFKARSDGPPVCAINVDDATGAWLSKAVKGRVITYGLGHADITPAELKVGATGIGANIDGCIIRSPLLGKHNVYNILCSFALLNGLGIPSEAISRGIGEVKSIPGRLEQVCESQGVTAFVDYAHTEESVCAVLETLQSVFSGRSIVTVVGCGGGTDRSKRSTILKAALRYSDACVLTSDNPRWEDPRQIVLDMLAGATPSPTTHSKLIEVVLDRRQAIYRAVDLARTRSSILTVLGKGAERFQEVCGRLIPLDDRQILADSLVPRSGLFPRQNEREST